MTDEAKTKFAKRCPNADDICLTDMKVDWLPRGDIQENLP